MQSNATPRQNTRPRWARTAGEWHIPVACPCGEGHVIPHPDPLPLHTTVTGPCGHTVAVRTVAVREGNPEGHHS